MAERTHILVIIGRARVHERFEVAFQRLLTLADVEIGGSEDPTIVLTTPGWKYSARDNACSR
jgi:hypothetical protein